MRFLQRAYLVQLGNLDRWKLRLERLELWSDTRRMDVQDLVALFLLDERPWRQCVLKARGMMKEGG